MHFIIKHNAVVSLMFIFFSSSIPIAISHPSVAQEDDNLFITQGVASGDVTDQSAIVWSRVNRQAQMNVEYDTDHNFSHPKLKTVAANQTTDFTGHAKLEDLKPDRLYYYRVWFTTQADDGLSSSNVLIGSFRTAPDDLTSKEVDFVISGDLGGQKYCRQINIGYSIFSIMNALSPNFFVFNGDQIYADNDCPREGPRDVIAWENIEGDFPSVESKSVNWTDLAQLHDIYLKHWEYNRNDTHLQTLLQHMPFYSQFDDHEVIDNYGGNWSFLPTELYNRTGYSNVVRTGINLFSNFSPIDTHQDKDRNRFYRSFNWGKGLDLFILDSRSYRSNNALLDTEENNKTLLGEEQLEWLKEGLLGSNATWKIISSPNSITIPTCFKYGCDSWATNGTDGRNFVRERSDLLKFFDDNDLKDVIFIVTDVHFPANILVNEDFNEDGDKLIFHELISGPLSASQSDAQRLDPTINATFLYNESKIFNFGHLVVKPDREDMKDHLVYRVIDSTGVIRPNSVLNLRPQQND